MDIPIPSNLLRHLFKDTYFITGTAYAGKSTMVRLLSERHDGILCGENYHEALSAAVDVRHQPNMAYFDTMSGWREFVTRTPAQYAAWVEGCSRESMAFELALLIQHAAQGKKIFVDTNIRLDVLKEISDYHHVAVMLAPPEMSVRRFFEREDREKQMLYRELLSCPDPEAALANFRDCLAVINSPEVCRRYAESGFFTWVRREESTPEEALSALEAHFGLAAP